MFLLLFTFQAFPYSSFFSSRKMATRIFSHLLWYHSLQTEQSAMKNPLFSFRSSSKNGTGHCNIMGGKRCVTSFPRLTRFACCGSDIGYKSYCKNSAIIPISLLLHRFWNYAKLCIFTWFLFRLSFCNES